jgi:hypothetical protein
LIGGLVGTAMLCRAFTRSSAGAYDRGSALFVEVGIGLVSDPARWTAVMGRSSSWQGCHV